MQDSTDMPPRAQAGDGAAATCLCRRVEVYVERESQLGFPLARRGQAELKRKIGVQARIDVNADRELYRLPGRIWREISRRVPTDVS